MDTMINWKPFWSFKEKYEPRPVQEKIINQIVTAISEGYTNIIVEAGTGIGKSAIATTISNLAGSSYILTRTKQLQQQYLSDFNNILVEIKGKGNYVCSRYSDPDNIIYCNGCIQKAKKRPLCQHCSFKLAKEVAKGSPIVLSNYHYLWNASKYSEDWSPRDLIVFDEAHKFEEFVMSVVSRKISRDYYLNHYGIDIFDNIINGDTLTEWSQPEKWVPVIDRLLELFRNEKRKYETKAENTSNKHDLLQLSKKIDNLEKRIVNFTEFKYTMVNDKWIVILPRKYEIEKNYRNLNVEFKPIDIRKYTKDFLNLGEIRLFLTGTIGNFRKFCEWININPKKSKLIRENNHFPVENRPIIKSYVGNLKGNLAGGAPKWKHPRVLEMVKNILSKHEGEKGIIHTTSHSQSNWLYEHLRDDYQLWKVSSDSNYNMYGLSREDLITRFKYWDEPVVLLSAGMKDGVDFPDDECRFQILFKMPIPRFDAQVYERNRKDRLWVPYQTVMDTVQAYGRGVRSETDYCVFYVLDAYMDSLLRKHRDLFTPSFLEALPRNTRPVSRPVKVKGGK